MWNQLKYKCCLLPVGLNILAYRSSVKTNIVAIFPINFKRTRTKTVHDSLCYCVHTKKDTYKGFLSICYTSVWIGQKHALFKDTFPNINVMNYPTLPYSKWQNWMVQIYRSTDRLEPCASDRYSPMSITCISTSIDARVSQLDGPISFLPKS